jgi:hypothetical protein
MTRLIEQTVNEEPSPGNIMSGALQMTQQAADGVSENAKAMMTPVEAGIFAGIAGAVGAGGLIVKSFDARSNTKSADAAVESAKANTKSANANEMSARANVMNVGIAAKKLELEIKQAEDKARNERKDQGPGPSSGSSSGVGKPSTPGSQPLAASSSSTKDQKADKLPNSPWGLPLKRSSTSPEITQSTGKGGLPKLDSVTPLETLLMEKQRQDKVSNNNAIWLKIQAWSHRREGELHNNVHHLVDEETNRRSLDLNRGSVASSKKQEGKGKGKGIAIELNNLIPQEHLDPTQPPDSDPYIAAVPRADEAESSGSSNNQAEERNFPNPDSGAHSKSLEEAHDRGSNIAEPQSEDPHGSSRAAHDLEKPKECLAAPDADEKEVEHATEDVPAQARVLPENTKASSDNAQVEDPQTTVEEEQVAANPVVRLH